MKNSGLYPVFLDGGKIAPLCAESDISQVTGHMIIERTRTVA